LNISITAKELAQIINGTVIGNEDVAISKPAKIEEGIEGTVSFLANEKYLNHIYSTKASIVIINKSFRLKQEVSPTLIVVDDAYQAFTTLLEMYQQAATTTATGVEDGAYVHETAKVGNEVYIASQSYVGANAQLANAVKIYPQSFIGANVTIGQGSTIHSGVKIYADCVIGENCIIHAGTIIGSDGFGFAPTANGDYKKIPQTGNVVIENNVEIGSNCCIDRATVGSTYIRAGVKLDNLIQVAHNVEIGKNTVIAAQTGVSGSTKIGEQCMIGGQVGFVGHVHIPARTKIQAQSGIAKEIKEENTAVAGSPAFGYREWIKSSIVFQKLPSLIKRLRIVEEKLNLPNQNQ